MPTPKPVNLAEEMIGVFIVLGVFHDAMARARWSGVEGGGAATDDDEALAKASEIFDADHHKPGKRSSLDGEKERQPLFHSH
jgi:hypothetical protein